MTSATAFSDIAWQRTADLRAAIDRLDFLDRLADGTLPPPAFRFYLEQDALYLGGFSKALALLSARAADPGAATFWATSAATAFTVERALHGDLLSHDLLATGDCGPAAARHSPTCLGYVSYLVATAATEPYPVAAAAVLPCFWIYAEVGARLAATAARVIAGDREHPYARWVTTYGDEEFRKSAQTARRCVDDAARDAGDQVRAAMIDAFTVATRYELLFWQSAADLEAWPPV